MTEFSLKEIKELLMQFKIKASHPRIIILKYLLENRIHPSVNKIYNELSISHPSLSKTTIYNTLKMFSKKGLVIELPLNGGEMIYDINIEPHIHFKCTKCKKIYDIKSEKAKNFFNLTGLKLDSHKVTNKIIILEGICRNCLEKR